MNSVTTSLIAALIVSAVPARGGTLRLAGTTGNSGEDGPTLVSFAGKPARGMGPVFDEASTLWERGGSRQLNRYALDGRLLASFEIPEGGDNGDVLTQASKLLVMRIGKSVLTLPVDAAAGTKPVKLPGDADAMSSGSFAGRVAICSGGALAWLDPATGARTEFAKADGAVVALCVTDDGTVHAFGEGRVNAWKDGQRLAGFPKPFHGERPQKIGRFWYSHAWHGTINRFNESFEPAPGVVLGGASGTFIGYLPQSADIENGRGMAHIGGDLFAVSGMGGVVQLLKWSGTELKFDVVRRIGALADITGVALDANGTIWTPYGSVRWNDTCDTPFSPGDKAPDVHTQPVVLGGKTLCLLKKHYSYVQLARGPLLDADGLSHFESPGVKDFEWPKEFTGAAAFPAGNGLRMIVVERGGAAWEFGINDQGQQLSKPDRVDLPGLKNCTGLAWFDEKLCAATDSVVIAYERRGNGWKEVTRLTGFGSEVFISGDGARLVVSDAQRGAVHLYESLAENPATYEGLKSPTHVAVSGNRIALYEAGQQRMVKLELTTAPAKPKVAVQPTPKAGAKSATFADEDFQEMGRAGGIPFAVALTTNRNGLTVSIRTRADATQVEPGVANESQAYVATKEQARQEGGRFHFVFPAGDWSKLRLAAAITVPGQQERFGFTDARAIHAPFAADASVWSVFDVESYREIVNARRQEICIAFEQPVDGKATLVIENEKGERVRNLVSGRAFAAGKQTVVWDGLDENGKLVAPGNYNWRGITHAGIQPRYQMSFANGGEDTTEPWGPNHSTLHAAAANGEYVFFAAPVTEGGWALIALDNNGKLVQGYEHQQGLGIGHDAIAADEKFLYVAQDGFGWSGTRGVDMNSDTWVAPWRITLVRFDIKSGKVADWPDKQRFVEVDSLDVGPGSTHPDLSDYNLGGLAVLDGKVYVGSRGKKAVLVLDAATGRRLDSIPCEGVRHLAAFANGSRTSRTVSAHSTTVTRDGRQSGDTVAALQSTEIYAATDRGVVRVRDQKLLVEAGAMKLDGVAIAPNGDIVVSDGASHQVRRFNNEGKLVATIGKAGGPYKGAYDPERLVNPAGLVFGPDGKLWVTERRWNPKRVLAWDLAQNKVVFEKFGMPHYGGDGSGFDPENPRRWIGLGCFWDVDIAKGTARPTHILSLEEGHFGRYEPQSYSLFREGGRTFVSTRGKIALISEVLPDGTLHDLAAVAGTHHFGYGCEWKPPQAYIDAFYAKWPAKRAGEKPGKKGEGKPWSQRGMGVLWVDRNSDGQAQVDEFDFCGDEIEFCGSAWGHMQNSLTLYVPVVPDKKQVKIVALKPRGMLPNGVPDYPKLDEAIAAATPVSLTTGYKRNGVATVRDHDGRFIFNSDPEMNAYAADGKWLWSYPNKWSDVHGSHDAPLPEPGVMQGTLAILGLAPFDKQGDVFFLNGNHGRCFMLTSDGLYLDEAFVDVRVSYLKNEYRLGGEIFGGSFGRAATDGKYYVQIGHGPYRIYELTGLQSAKRISGNVSMSRVQIAAVEKQNLRKAAAKQVARELTLPGKIRWDKSGKFKIEAEVSADATHLHLTYQVQDVSPWVNNGRDWAKLFATGDTVDFQFGADADANPKRREPVAGDKRLSIAPFEGKPVAVLYEYRKAGGKNPMEFTSPWRGAKVDDVRQIAGARIEVKTEGGAYMVKASVPLAELGLSLVAGKSYAADFGVTFGDANGTDSNLRSYWSNQSTGLVDDIPGEIMLSPNLWGTLRVAK